MRTRRNRSRKMPENWHYAVAAWRARDLARRVALPARLPPAERQRIVITIDCGSVVDVLEIVAPDCRARSDQAAVIHNGARLSDLSNRTAIGRLVARLLPRQATKMQQHEADRIGEDWI